jgi:hypothetical protein
MSLERRRFLRLADHQRVRDQRGVSQNGNFKNQTAVNMTLATNDLSGCLLWVKTSRQNMSAGGSHAQVGAPPRSLASAGCLMTPGRKPRTARSRPQGGGAAMPAFGESCRNRRDVRGASLTSRLVCEEPLDMWEVGRRTVSTTRINPALAPARFQIHLVPMRPRPARLEAGPGKTR